MRLPWLQASADGLTRARNFGRLFGIGEDAGVGVVLRLWAWVLEMSADGDFRGLVADPRALAAGAGLNPDDSGRVVTELQRVGLVATTPQLRVRGLDRYVSTWRKNRKRQDGPPVPVLTIHDPAPEPKPKTETETDIEDLHPLPPEITGAASSQQGSPQAHDGLEGDVDDWLRWATHERAVRGFTDAPGDSVRSLTRYLLGKHGTQVRPALELAFTDFLDGWGALEGRRCAWGLWLEPNVHEPRLADARVALGGAPRARRLNIVDAEEVQAT